MIPNLFRGVYQIRTDDQGVAVPRLTTWLRRLILSYSSNPMVFWVSCLFETYKPCFASLGAATQSHITSLSLVTTVQSTVA